MTMHHTKCRMPQPSRARRARGAALGGTLLLAAMAAAASLAAQAPNDVSRLAFMAGCWELRTPTRITHEQWMAPLGGLMLGMSRTVVRDVAREWEALRVEVKDGVATYLAQPGGRPATPFPATALTDSSVTFANPSHDFPQRILYRKVGADSLVARIEGDQGGQVRGMNFPMKRVACAGG